MLVFILSCLSFVSAYATVTNCATVQKPSLFTIDTLTLSPADTIMACQNVSLGLIYTSPESVTSGTATTSITYNFLPIEPTVDDLCLSIPCPLDPGTHDGSTTYPFPQGLSGTIVTTIVWADSNNTQLLCIKITLKTQKSFFL